jgi:tetratricopeptide (TPR) repeat protein
MSRHSDAIACNERGNSCREAGNWQAAIELYEQAARLAPKWSSPHYNLGLVHKYQSHWRESFDCNRRATKLDPKDEAAWWNLGIAATALGDWTAARDAWRGFGIEIPNGDGPLDFPCGNAPIRLNPDGPNVEVVWADRLCPARARILNIPLPESGHRWRDVVLHDGAPVGYRNYRGREMGVYNELERLEPAPYGTFLIEIDAADDPDWFEHLENRAVESDLAVEDWSQSIHLLCKACSEGLPHKRHDTELEPEPIAKHRVAIAALRIEDARELVAAFRHECSRWSGEAIQTLVAPLA